MSEKTKRTKPRIWIGQFRFGARTIYAVTAASTRGECKALIKGGPFYNTVARQWFLTPTRKARKP
jgi:hypothetical protein